MNWKYNDGGREAAGFKGETRDCVTRAIAIATDLPYRTVYDTMNELTAERRQRGLRMGARTGMPKKMYAQFLNNLGWVWHPTMSIGSGTTVHLRADELPAGRIIAEVSRHTVAVLDGVIQDTHDPSRDGTRCVYGYWTAPC